MADELPPSMSIPEAGRYFLGLGRDASYEAARRGVLVVIKAGPRSQRVPTAAMLRKMERAGDGEQ